jgi:hypothetical protein
MAQTVSAHQLGAISTPASNAAIVSSVVRGNFQSTRTAFNAHDADPGVHLQSSVLASRPAAGVAGRKWLTTDDGPKLWYDTGSVWTEIGYVPTTGTAVVSALQVTGALEVDGTTLTVDATNNRVGVGTATPGVALDVVGTTRTSNGLTVTAGGITVSAGASTFADAVSVTGTVTATTFAGSGASLTALPAAELTGTLPAISGANLTSLNASNISSGTINAARLPTIPLATAAGTAGALNVGSGAFTVTPDGAETQFIAASTTASWFGTTAPGGSGTSRWINVTLNGTACRIECKTVA